MPPRIFCSYARQDVQFARELIVMMRRLTDCNKAELIVDVRDFGPGAAWEGRIEDGISRADIVLFLVSAASLASRWCEREVGLARERRKLVIPVRLFDCDLSQAPWIAELQGIPEKPITATPSHILAWDDVVERIAGVLAERQNSPSDEIADAQSELMSRFLQQFPPSFITGGLPDKHVLAAAIHPDRLPPVFYHWRVVGAAVNMHWIDFVNLQILRNVADCGFRIELLINDVEADDRALLHRNTQAIVDGLWSSSERKPKIVWLSRLKDIDDAHAFVRSVGLTVSDEQRVRSFIDQDTDTMFDVWLYLAMFHSRNEAHFIFYVRGESDQAIAARQRLCGYLRDRIKKVQPYFIYRPTYGKKTGLGKRQCPGETLVIDAPAPDAPPRYRALLTWLEREENADAVTDLARYLTLDKVGPADAPAVADGAESILERASALLSTAPGLSERLRSSLCPSDLKRGALVLLEAMLEWNTRFFGPAART